VTEGTLGIGVIGCGRAAEDLHLPAIARNPHATAVAITDIDAHARMRLAGRFGIARQYAEVDALLADPAVELVVVCAPPHTHADLALAAVAAGKHVLVEKPLALDVVAATRMAEAERSASVVTALGLNLRCHRLVEAARAIVAAGTLGPIATLRTTWTAGYERGRPIPEWRRIRESGGGVLYEIGTHHVDLWRHLLGEEIDEIGALCRAGETEDETAVLTGRSSGGAIVSAVLSDQAPDANEVDVTGRDGRLRFSLYRGDSLEVTTTAPDYRPRARARALVHRAAALPTVIRAARTGGDFVNSYGRQLERVIAAVRGEGTLAATWADGLEAARIVAAAAAAAGAPRPIAGATLP
jgi:predicted dehydrogenase